jgi:hypothetical protein
VGGGSARSDHDEVGDGDGSCVTVTGDEVHHLALYFNFLSVITN